ncbi:MAG: hypothetical protein IJ439_04515 [Tyzzerella sp.]|nr:hypothetical protein [Tyzzerella sp.]
MKKKITSLGLVAIIAIMAIAGASLAYLKDTDQEDNVFTVGNVEIDLTENFDESLAKLMPAVGSAQNGTLQNGIQKEVFVTNTGSENAYVRVHIAIPTILDNGDPSFDASSNVLHFNYDGDNIGENKWDWSNATGAPYEGSWNYYETTIDDIAYNVYVVTYEKALVADEKTVSAMTQVYLDSKVTNEDINSIKKTLGDDWHIYVAAEGVQAAGFANAYTALNTAFGTPGSYAVEWVAQ